MVGRRNDITPEMEHALLNQARALRSGGMSWPVTARWLGVGESWLKRRMIPGYAEAENARVHRRLAGNCKLPGSNFVEARPMTEDELRAVRARNPRDTRDATGIAFGDPIFERSALFQRRVGISDA